MLEFRMVKAYSSPDGYHEDVYEIMGRQTLTADIVIELFIKSPYHPFTVAYGTYVVGGDRLIHAYDTSD